MKGIRHKAVSIPLDKSHIKKDREPKQKNKYPVYYLAPTSRKIVTWLREYVRKDLASLEHCPNCGGILPELMFSFEGKDYWFTCYQIRENDKVVAQTDYETFASFCGQKKV